MLHFTELSSATAVKRRSTGVGPIPPECVTRARDRLLRYLQPPGGPSSVQASTPRPAASLRHREQLAKLDRLCGAFCDPLDSPKTTGTPRARVRAGLTARREPKTPRMREAEPSPALSLGRGRERTRPTESRAVAETSFSEAETSFSGAEPSIADLVKTRKRRSASGSQELNCSFPKLPRS